MVPSNFGMHLQVNVYVFICSIYYYIFKLVLNTNQKDISIKTMIDLSIDRNHFH